MSVTFNAGELKNALVVPTGAIVQQDNAQGVFVAQDQGNPVFVPVIVGVTVNDKTQVNSDLAPFSIRACQRGQNMEKRA